MTAPDGDRWKIDGALLRRADTSPNAIPFLSRFSLSRLNSFDLATLTLFATLLVLVVLTFRVYAVTNDEWVQHHYGELILNYYKSGFTDRALFHCDNTYFWPAVHAQSAQLYTNTVSNNDFRGFGGPQGMVGA